MIVIVFVIMIKIMILILILIQIVPNPGRPVVGPPLFPKKLKGRKKKVETNGKKKRLFFPIEMWF